MTEIGILLAILTMVFLLSGKYDIFEATVLFVEEHEKWEMDELIVTAAFSSLVLIVFVIRRWMVNRRLSLELAHQFAELKKAQEEIRQLKGIMPICSSCKKSGPMTGSGSRWNNISRIIHKPHSPTACARPVW